MTPGALMETATTARSPSRGTARHFFVHGGARVTDDAVWDYPDSPIEVLRDRVRFDWGALDAWFEEDEEVFVHPRNPYTRVDFLRSPVRVRIEVDGVLVAETASARSCSRPVCPPATTSRSSTCAWTCSARPAPSTHVPLQGHRPLLVGAGGDEVHEDLAWATTPRPRVAPIAGLVAFYNEKVDAIVDGQPLPRPNTHFT